MVAAKEVHCACTLPSNSRLKALASQLLFLKFDRSFLQGGLLRAACVCDWACACGVYRGVSRRRQKFMLL